MRKEEKIVEFKRVLAEFKYNVDCLNLSCSECSFKKICDKACNLDLEDIDISDEEISMEEFKERFKDYINKYWSDVL